MAIPLSQVGLVLIGRNEARNLQTALGSVPQGVARVIYVDSGSTDGSIAIAEAAGADVVRLDPAAPFTAARARNAGAARLRQIGPTPFIQFCDADCALQPGWIEAALGHMSGNPDCAVVCGRRRERFPDASDFNRLCDMEWNTPVGEARACGGDSLMRARAFDAMGGFNPILIAGEEPDLCQRMRRDGWTIWRIDHEMTLHDADLHRLAPWWTRMRRGGYAAAEGAMMHGAGPDRHGLAQTGRALFWGLVLPAFILGTISGAWGLSLLGLAIYPAQILRLTRRFAPEDGRRAAARRATLLMLGKCPEMLGVLHCLANHVSGRRGRLIEYK